MKQTLDTQEARDSRIRELTDWNDGDYERFATRPVERQLSLITANAAPPAIDWNAPLDNDDAWESEKIAVFTDAERCERRA